MTPSATVSMPGVAPSFTTRGLADWPGIGFGEIANVAPGTEVPNWSTFEIPSSPQLSSMSIVTAST